MLRDDKNIKGVCMKKICLLIAVIILVFLSVSCQRKNNIEPVDEQLLNIIERSVPEISNFVDESIKNIIVEYMLAKDVVDTYDIIEIRNIDIGIEVIECYIVVSERFNKKIETKEETVEIVNSGFIFDIDFDGKSFENDIDFDRKSHSIYFFGIKNNEVVIEQYLQHHTDNTVSIKINRLNDDLSNNTFLYRIGNFLLFIGDVNCNGDNDIVLFSLYEGDRNSVMTIWGANKEKNNIEKQLEAPFGVPDNINDKFIIFNDDGTFLLNDRNGVTNYGTFWRHIDSFSYAGFKIGL